MNVQVPLLTFVFGVALSCGGKVSQAPASGERAATVLPSPGTSGSPETQPPASSATIEAGGNVVALATETNHICWTTFAKGSASAALVACVSKTDGTRVELVHDALLHPSIAIHGDRVFWSTEMTATIEQAALSGGPPAPFVTRSGPHGRFVMTSTFGAYWLVDAGATDTFLFSSSPASESRVVSNLGAANADLLAVDEWSAGVAPTAYYFSNGVTRLDLNRGGPSTALSKGCLYPADLVVGRDSVFWSCEDGTFHWVPKNADSPGVDRSLGGIGSGRVAAGAAGLAYVTDVGGGRVWKVRLADATSVSLAEGLEHPNAIAADDSGVYVGDGQVIRRLPL